MGIIFGRVGGGEYVFRPLTLGKKEDRIYLILFFLKHGKMLALVK
jgi:hypothetical protein